MYSIAYVVPYFGKLPNYFPLWLTSCKCNPTVDWLVFTDDKTEYDYPENVKVTYCTLDDIRDKAQALFDFTISLERPYKLCDFKPAYGEIFQKELEGYDFFGHCDIDQVWGNIRAFYTDEVLENYDKIGFDAHSVLYRNTEEMRSLYRTIVDGEETQNYINVYSTDKGFAFDEAGMEKICESKNIPVFRKIVYANLAKYHKNFSLSWITPEDEYKNEHQIFVWENGTVKRYYYHNGEIGNDEFMYLHYWCRPTTIKIKDYDTSARYLIYPDVTTDKSFKLTPKFVLRKSRGSFVIFMAKTLYRNRKKLTPERILFNIKDLIKKKTRNKYYDQSKYQ